MKRVLLCLGASLALVACTDPIQPAIDAAEPLAAARAPKARALFARYVSLGTSLSMGVQGAGIYDDAQAAAWPSQLAGRVGAPFTIPLIQDPGCPPPLLAPLALNLALLGAFSAFGAGEDLLDGLGGVCMPLQSGISPPTGNVAISGADVHDARFLTPELAAAQSTRKGQLYSRVLASGQTQVTAMLSQDPTFVSIELAANEILPASTGLVSALTPYANWELDYDAVVAAVRSTGARGLIVGLPHSAANFPSVATARAFFHQWPYLLGLGIAVSWSCYYSSNYLFIPGYVMTLLSRAPTTATCADVPGEVDYVLTPGDMATIDAQMARMNEHMQRVASDNDWAFFDISVVYDLPKIPLDLSEVLFSSQPFGPYMSLDGVHPNSAGQALLADAAADAIKAQYRVALR